MIRKFNQFLNEEYFQEENGTKVYNLLYYAFDWDDNILKMPTEIILLSNGGEEVGMSTQDFAEYREKIGKEEFEYQGQIIVGYAKDAFRYFRDEIDPEIFVKDTQKALAGGMYAKAWNDFIMGKGTTAPNTTNNSIGYTLPGMSSR